MENKKKFAIFTLGLVIVLSIFFISFYFTLKQLEKNTSKSDVKDEISINTSSSSMVSDDAKIELYFKDKNGDMKKEAEVSLKELKGKIKGDTTIEALQEYYQREGYFYRPSLTNEKNIIFEKRFIPNKYYISVDDKDKEMTLCIYKADKEGKLVKEKQTGVKFNARITKEEKELFIKGYGGEKNEGFTSVEEAEEYVKSTFQS